MIASENFPTFLTNTIRAMILRISENVWMSVAICTNFEQDYHNLFFYGTVGTGKSFCRDVSPVNYCKPVIP